MKRNLRRLIMVGYIWLCFWIGNFIVDITSPKWYGIPFLLTCVIGFFGLIQWSEREGY